MQYKLTLQLSYSYGRLFMAQTKVQSSIFLFRNFFNSPRFSVPLLIKLGIVNTTAAPTVNLFSQRNFFLSQLFRLILFLAILFS